MHEKIFYEQLITDGHVTNKRAKEHAAILDLTKYKEDRKKIEGR